MKEKNKTYTAEDFARYYAGTMPDNEMHALEKAALEDPFLEDALEGYVHAHTVESDIAELQARLTEKQKNKKVFFISSVARSKWWRIAALFIVIAGAGYFFYRVNSVSKEDSLAKNVIKASTEKKDNTAPVKTDSAIVKDDIAFEKQTESKFAQKEKAAFPKATPRIEKDINASIQRPESVQAPGPDNKSKDGISSDGRLKEAYKKEVSKEGDLQVEKEHVLKGKVADKNGQAVPYASIADKARDKVTITDTAGRFLLRSTDSSITATASAAGYASKAVKLKKDSPSTIAMNKTNDGLNEVVVTALGQRKQLKEPASASKALNGKVPGVQITSPGLQPSGGKEKFDRYVEENLKLIYDENNEPLTGEVLLSFTINKKGRPKNIKVVRSSCGPCENEAINLLENGPGWTGGKNVPGTVMIKF
jgi:CarboxypepD_reg-like domain/Gram-negative bacterial TonB protein C-terminal